MNRKEPYIGMPIILGDFDDAPTGSTNCGCDVEIKPQPQPTPPPEYAPEEPPQPEPSQRMVVGMAYVPWQKWQQTYELAKGFNAGTIFPDLNYPFEGYQGGLKR